MTFITVHCPHCDSEQIVKRGKTHSGTQRYLCQNTECARGSFLLDYRNRGCLPEVKQQIIDMSLNASGVRDTARVLRISTDTVLSELKKKEAVLESVNTVRLRTINPDDIAVHIERAGEAEMDEMWSFVGKKREPRWLWHAIDHHSGTVLAYVFGRRKDAVSCAARLAFPKQRRCTIWSLASSSSARNLGALSNTGSTPVKHLRNMLDV
jgi:insertion element IS1 protein InsB